MGSIGKWAVAVAVGITLGLALSFVASHPEARAAGPKQKWEFKVVSFGGEDKNVAKELQELADDGWEYVGLIGTSTYSPRGLFVNSRVAFKRPRK
jgi:hypothetical protein